MTYRMNELYTARSTFVIQIRNSSCPTLWWLGCCSAEDEHAGSIQAAAAVFLMRVKNEPPPRPRASRFRRPLKIPGISE